MTVPFAVMCWLFATSPLPEVTSIVRFPSGAESTAFDAKGCDELGLPRLRIAGSRVLQVVQDALRFIPDCNVPQVWDDSCSSLDESRVYDLLSAGYTAGIPFLDGMKSELMQQKLTSFAELIDICHSRGADRRRCCGSCNVRIPCRLCENVIHNRIHDRNVE